jgi:hypothetical protein
MAEEKNIEFISREQEEKEHNFSFREFLDGSILTKKIVVKQLPFILFLTFLALLYIGNRYRAERIYRNVTELQEEVRNLRTEQIITAAKLMNLSRPSSVSQMVNNKNLGLKELTTPPKVIKTKKK